MIQGDQAVAQLQTIRDFIRWGASRFNEAGLVYGHGTDNALDESVALVLHTLHLQHDLPSEYALSRLTESEKQRVVTNILRRVNERVPVPYITHEAWFAGIPFYVDERVLIPRSPIAELIENGFSPWIEEGQVTSILDLCTGSGCIGIACALAFPEADVDAADISDEALAVAQVNVQRHGLEEELELVKSDLFDNLAGRRYDIIVSNPPYVDAGEMAALSPEFKHEPRLGLSSGEDGLEATCRILAQAADHLNPGGILVVEVGNSELALMHRFPEVPFIWLDFERGGQGVFLLTYDQIQEFSDQFQADVGS